MTTQTASTTGCRIPRVLGYAAVMIAGAVIGSTLFGWAVIGLTTLLHD